MDMKIEKLTCPNCSAKITENQTTCSYCGTNLVVSAEQDTKSPNENTVINQNNISENIIAESQSTQNFATPNSVSDISPDVMKLSLEVAEANKQQERKHRLISSIVSGITGIAGIISGIILLDEITYLGVVLILLGILCVCKIFYTNMRASYNMTPAGYTYSAIICVLISGFAIFGGCMMIEISDDIENQICSIIPFFLALVSITYFIAKTIFYIREKKFKK